VVALTNAAFAIRKDLQARFLNEKLQWLSVDLTPLAPDAADLPEPDPQDIAFLQYTSGSTSEPKGVAVSHANLLANLEMIRVSLGTSKQSTYVNWVPLYHDMGLILNALQAFYVGALCVLMAPNAFMQRPLNWLRAIHQYRAEVGCSPNFGFDLCVSRYRADQMQGVDLSSWKVALNGAEPVHAETIQRFHETFAGHGFDPNTTFPAYGMAEATLLISGGRRGAGHVTRTVSRSPHRSIRPTSRPWSAVAARWSTNGSRSSIRTAASACLPTRSARSGPADRTSRALIGETPKPRRRI
jgi:acyl-CoA synthetase (AMP-forming)/AMP-acid ligase II